MPDPTAQELVRLYSVQAVGCSNPLGPTSFLVD